MYQYHFLYNDNLWNSLFSKSGLIFVDSYSSELNSNQKTIRPIYNCFTKNLNSVGSVSLCSKKCGHAIVSIYNSE